MGQEDKRMLRRAVRARLAAMSDAEKEQLSAAICRSLKAHIAVTGARVVALFSPLPDEPRIWPLVEELSKSMLVLLPRVEGDVMNFCCYSPESMSSGAFGIMEPVGGEPVASYEIDVMVVPGVAFTAKGERMGRGKGFYDKYMSLKDFRAVKIGVCYDVQLVDVLPTEIHDVKMDSVIYK